jgi:uncharacterized coiled-coil DUF342 family protein
LFKLLEIFLNLPTADKFITIFFLLTILPITFYIFEKTIKKFEKKIEITELNITNEIDKIFIDFCNEFKKDCYHSCQSNEYRKVQDSLIENIADNQKDFEKIMQQLTFIIDSSKSEKYDFFSRIDKVINEIDMIKNNSKNFNDVLDKIKEFLIEVNNEIKNIRRG